MTRYEFIAACGERLIPVDLALENDAVTAALKDRDDDAVCNALDTEF